MAKIPTILEAGRADGKLITSNNVYDNNQQKFLSDKLEEIDNNHNALNDVVNSLADEEDITRNTDGKLQFKNKESGDGMGYVILRTNKSFSEQVTKENTIYEIRYKFDLKNISITLPANCILKFEGGKIINGILIGNKTSTNINDNKCYFNNIILNGTWNFNILYPENFGSLGDGLNNDVQIIKNTLYAQKIILTGVYKINSSSDIVLSLVNHIGTIEIEGGGTLYCPSSNSMKTLFLIKQSKIIIKNINFKTDADALPVNTGDAQDTGTYIISDGYNQSTFSNLNCLVTSDSQLFLNDCTFENFFRDIRLGGYNGLDFLEERNIISKNQIFHCTIDENGANNSISYNGIFESSIYCSKLAHIFYFNGSNCNYTIIGAKIKAQGKNCPIENKSDNLSLNSRIVIIGSTIETTNTSEYVLNAGYGSLLISDSIIKGGIELCYINNISKEYIIDNCDITLDNLIHLNRDVTVTSKLYVKNSNIKISTYFYVGDNSICDVIIENCKIIRKNPNADALPMIYKLKSGIKFINCEITWETNTNTFIEIKDCIYIDKCRIKQISTRNTSFIYIYQTAQNKSFVIDTYFCGQITNITNNTDLCIIKNSEIFSDLNF